MCIVLLVQSSLAMSPMSIKLLLLVISCVSFSSSHVYKSPLSLIKRDKITYAIDANVSTTVSLSVFENQSTWVNVSILGVGSPGKDDWIGLFVLESDDTTEKKVDPQLHAPVKFKYVASDSNAYLSSGKANITFHLINMRNSYIFQLFSGGLDSPVLISVSNTVRPLNPNYPMQGHLSASHKNDEMILQWVTKNVSDPQVQWDTSSKTYSFSSKKVNTSTYTAKDLCGPPATDYGWMDPGLLHTVAMTGLKPSTRYYYRFGSAMYGWSDEFSFLSPPVTAPNSSVRMIAYGDLGHGELDQSLQIKKLEQASLNTTKAVFSEINDTQLLIHIGDLSYAVGFAAQWDEYFTEIEKVAARVPYMVCDGNHETDWPGTESFFTGKDSGGECNVPYIARSPMPREKPSTPWYGFDFGCIHFVMMSGEHNFTIDSEQYKFLVSHLASVNRSVTPWLIFTGHRPMYVDSSQSLGNDSMQVVAKLLRESLESVLKKYKVNIAFWGHHHTYQRTCQMYDGACSDGDPMHVIIGMAGRPLLQDFTDNPPSYFKYLDDQHYGYTRIMANETTLVFQYVRNDDHEVHDEVIFKQKSAKPSPHDNDGHLGISTLVLAVIVSASSGSLLIIFIIVISSVFCIIKRRRRTKSAHVDMLSPLVKQT